MGLSLNTAAIRQRFGPSLARRVFLAIAISNTIISIFFFSKAMLDHQTIDLAVNIRLVARGSYRLNQFTSEQDARAFGAAWHKGFFCLPFCYTEVWAHDGKRIYADKTWPQGSQPAGIHGKSTMIIIEGTSYDMFRHDGPHWSLRLIKPRLTLSRTSVMLVTELNLFDRALIFFSFLMLPLWFAVSRGLAPLRALAHHLGQRAAGDLTPLNVNTPYRELKPLVAALNALLLQLRGKVQREYAFLQDATHELRTPIAVIPAQAHILAKATTPSAQAAAKQQIDHALARAFHLIAQLSELARVDTQPMPESQVQDVVALVKLDLMQIEQAALARQITLQLTAPDTLLHPLESNTFLSIFHNLVSNAIRYGRVGGRVVVTLRQEDHNLFLSVADDGPGISPEQREQVFERFYRGLGHDASGSGLGLAIVRQAAARLYAKLELLDGLPGLNGRGCCFAVWIPDQGAQPSGPR